MRELIKAYVFADTQDEVNIIGNMLDMYPFNIK